MPRKPAGLLIAALVAVAGSLTACGGSGGGGSTASPPNVLKVWWYEGPGSAYQIAWDQAITDFKKQHPGVTVQFS
ncbi:MAG: raffinose/stachyose/melibiose transport system substrate-binding protein, partial [Trebonia sp.]|nr:raffinose/stachyose/melibiose transport system substrate-binding protein [Trebonia sp.]